jgi:hypothetical protein
MDSRSAGTQFLAGSLAALVAAVGLIRFGAAPFQLLRDALVWSAGDPLPVSLQRGGSAALCSLLFGVATLMALVGLLRLTRMAAFSSLALILVIASGAASAAGGAGLCLAASRELASFRVIAMSAQAPKEDELGVAVQYAMGPARVGFAGLLAGSAVLVVLSCGSLKHNSRFAPSRFAARVVGGLSAASVVAFAVLLAATWFPMHELAGRLTSGEAMKPSEIALPISRTLELSLLAGAALLAYGVFLVLTGILLRRANP